jgi:hypothetical protein
VDDNPYAPPTAVGDDGRSTFADGDPGTAELRAFVGARADRFLLKWSALRKGSGRTAGFNVAAFVFGPLWFAYRKLYREVVFVCVVFIALGIVEMVLFRITGRELPVELDSVLNVAVGVTFALVANPLYYRRAKLVLRSVPRDDEATRIREIARLGGTSWVGAVVTLAIMGFGIATLTLLGP